MTTTGSQMRISLFNFMIQTPILSFKVKIAELELPSSMMTSPDKFASKILMVLRFSQLTSMLRSQSSERMEVTVSSLLNMRLSKLEAQSTSLKTESTTLASRTLWSSKTRRLKKLFMSNLFHNLRTKKKIKLIMPLDSSFRTRHQPVEPS